MKMKYISKIMEMQGSGASREICSTNAYIRRRQWHPTPVLLPGKSHGRRSLVGCRPWGRYESNTTERLHFHFSLSRIRERNGNPLQCSCLENPRDGGAWRDAIYGAAQSRTRLKRLTAAAAMWVCVCVCVHACPLSLGYVIGMTTPQEQGLSFTVISPLPCIGPDPGKVPNERKEGDGYEGFEWKRQEAWNIISEWNT